MNLTAYRDFGISGQVCRLSERALHQCGPVFRRIDAVRESNQLRVIGALQRARLAESALGGSTGYGYGDLGREQLEQAYALAFGAESALVRIQISSGTQALALCLLALLRPGDTLLSVTGQPYDTLQTLIGQQSPEPEPGASDTVHVPCCPVPDGTGQVLPPEDTGSLRDLGIHYRQVDLLPDGSPDLAGISQAIRESNRIRVILIQKSRGYSMRQSLRAPDVTAVCRTVRESGSRAAILVDNCYGEFVETVEPCMCGADLCAGSLIKNPGGGLCPSGGYIAGRSDLVERVAGRLNAPGLGSHVGPSLGFTRLIAQGLYMAPHVVSESLKGAVFAAALFQLAGFHTFPGPFDERGDIVQTVELATPERLVAFCQAIQAASPVDSFAVPEPWAMPGYDDPVIMAAGAFVQGASIELSADGPLRPPYPAYLQGGLCFENIRLACLMAVERWEVLPDEAPQTCKQTGTAGSGCPPGARPYRPQPQPEPQPGQQSV